MGVRIQELPETTGINKEDVLIVEDGQGTKKGTVQQLDEALGVSQIKEDLANELENGFNYINSKKGVFYDSQMVEHKSTSWYGICEKVSNLSFDGYLITKGALSSYSSDNLTIYSLAFFDIDKALIESSFSSFANETFVIPDNAHYVVMNGQDGNINVFYNSVKGNLDSINKTISDSKFEHDIIEKIETISGKLISKSKTSTNISKNSNANININI